MTSSGSAALPGVALPTATVDTSMPAVTGQTINVAAGGNLQAAINSAHPGDEIVLAAGAVFRGAYTLPNKSGDGWITIRSAGSLPAAGTRATAADAGAMATLMAPGSNSPALATEPGAHNYRIVGLNITAAPGVTQMTSLVNLGDGNSTQHTLAAQPSNIIIDRSYIHGSATLDLRRGVALNSANSAVIDSTISEIHSKDSDSQAIAGWNGTGPYLIKNNQLEASGENVMFGGSDPSIPNALPSDITITGNTFYKPLSWQGVWLTKNLFELKIGQRVLVENNTFENNWADAQSGFAINIKSTNQDGTAPWSNTSNVTIRNNLIKNSPSGITVAASPDGKTAVPASNIAISGNTFQNIGGTAAAPGGTLFQLFGAGASLRNISVTDNVALQGDGNLNSTLVFDGNPTQGLTFANNRLTQGLYGIKGSGAGEGAATLSAYAPGAAFTGNTLIGGQAANYGAFAAQNSFSATSTVPVATPSPGPTSSQAARPSSSTLTSLAPLDTATSGIWTTTASFKGTGGFTLHGSATLQNGGQIMQDAAVQIGDGSGSAAALLNRAGAIYALKNDADIGVGTNRASQFDNAGKLMKSDGQGTSVVKAAFTNQGGSTAKITVMSGTLSFQGSTNVFAAQAVRGAGTLALSGGQNTITSGTAIATSGLTIENGGTSVTLGQNLTYRGSFTDAGGTTLNIGGNTLTLSGSTTFRSAGGASPTLGGSGTVILSGSTSIDGLAVTGSVQLRNTSAVTQRGNVTIGGLGSDAGIVNGTNAVWRIVGDGNLSAGTANAKFNNAGSTLIKSGGTGTSMIGAAITSTERSAGRVEVAQGTLELDGAITGRQVLQADADTTLILGTSASSMARFVFGGDNSVLQLNAPQGFAGSITGFGAGRTVDVRGLAAGHATLSYDNKGGSGILSLHAGSSVTALTFDGTFSASDFVTGSDGHGGLALTFRHA